MGIRWKRKDLLENYAERIAYAEICKRRREQEVLLDREHWHRVRELFSQLPEPEVCKSKVQYDDCITMSPEEVFQEDARRILYELLEAMRPWRKGPF